MEVTLKSITVQLGTSGVSYTLTPNLRTKRHMFVCDSSGNSTPLKARDISDAHHEMREILGSRHNEILLPSVFWFEKKDNAQVELTVKDVNPRLITVWIGGLDDEISASFYRAIVESGHYRAALHGDTHIHVELTPKEGLRRDRYRVLEELLGLLEA